MGREKGGEGARDVRACACSGGWHVLAFPDGICASSISLRFRRLNPKP
jgi:hypothetical protein